MTAVLSALFLVAGSALCLVAAAGVLRLPDYFMRMHAATKAGVAGCGLVLIGVAFGAPSVAMWIKVAIAIVFLLLTTPIAGHLLGRAGYIGGVPLWRNTVVNELEDVLPRGDFDNPTPSCSQAPAERQISRVVLAIASGSGMDEAMAKAVELAKEHRVSISTFAVVDTKMLHNVGPVPVGGNHHARQLRNSLTSQARTRVAAAIETFERRAAHAGIDFSVRVEEGDPAAYLREMLAGGTVLVMPRHTWFDHGLASGRIDPASALGRYGIATPDNGSDDNGPLILYG